jgi:hypothetical protein
MRGGAPADTMKRCRERLNVRVTNPVIGINLSSADKAF